MKKLYTIILSVILLVTYIHSSGFKVPELVYKSQTFDYDFRIAGEDFKYTFVPALEMTYQYEYSPAVKNGKPVSTIIEILFEFNSNSHLLDKYILNK